MGTKKVHLRKMHLSLRKSTERPYEYSQILYLIPVENFKHYRKKLDNGGKKIFKEKHSWHVVHKIQYWEQK